MPVSLTSITSLLVPSLLLVCAGAASDTLPEKARVWEGFLDLPTYPWYDDENPVFAAYEDAIYYPYTRQDHIAKESSVRRYKALFLENEYLRVTCLPELGGRVHSVFDKVAGVEMFHTNNEIKPALIAMRGAWIGGGIEWNPGPHGHTVTIVSPVDCMVRENEDGSASLFVSNTEQMFRTRWSVRLTLHPGKAYLDEEIRIFNPADGVHPYYFWNCTGFPNRPGTRFIYPMTLGTDHAGATFFQWPIHEGRDLSWLKNYDTMTSIFAYDCVFDFFGAYDVDGDRGIVSHANHHILKGKKAWTWGQDDFGIVSQMALSDAGRDGVPYIEVQSGPLLTQADYGMLRPRQAIAWREYWYPVRGLGDGFEYAARDAAVQVHRLDDALELRIAATGVFPGARCRLSHEGKELLYVSRDLIPEKTERIALPEAPAGPIRIELLSRDGDVLIDYESPLAIPHVTAPDLNRPPAREDGQPTAEEKYLEAYLLDSQSSPKAARAAYEAALAIDPHHMRTRVALAALDIEDGLWASAAEHAAIAVRRDPGWGEAWYWLGVARMQQGDFDEAVRYGYKAAAALDAQALGRNLVGRARMRQGNYAAAAAAFEEAAAHAPLDNRNHAQWLMARHAAGDAENAARDAAAYLEQDPLDFAMRTVIVLRSDGALREFLTALDAFSGEKEYTLLECAALLADLGLDKDAARLLDAACMAQDAPFPCSPLACYQLAHYAARAGDEPLVQAALDRAAALPEAPVFPGRLEEALALEYAVRMRPADARAHLLLGHARAARGHLDDALPHWRAAVDHDPALGIAWRLIGLHAWKKENSPANAVEVYQRATALRPKDQIAHRELAEILSALGRRPEAIETIAHMPKEPSPRYDIVLWLAEAYCAEARYDECIDLLATARFSNWEGVTKPHDIFVGALLARGRLHFEAERLEDALADFQRALTYPENLEVGMRYRRTDAEVCYWLGKTLHTLGRIEAACEIWREGAAQITSADPPLPFIPVTPAQDEHVRKCAEALNGGG